MAFETNITLLDIKSQVGAMLNAINNLNSSERSEALEFLQECLMTCIQNETPLKIDNNLIGELSPDKQSVIPFEETYQTVLKDMTQDIICDQSSNSINTGDSKTSKLNQDLEATDSPFTCLLCPKICDSKESLLEHFNTHSGTQTLCEQCNVLFSCEKAYEYHLKTELCIKTNKNYFECPECLKSFNTRRNFTMHIEGHKANNCKYCSAKFTHRKHLSKHLFRVHDKKLESAYLKCRYCDKHYVKKRVLNLHIARTHSDGKFPCVQCGNVFDTNLEFENHRETHTERIFFECSRCKEKFTRRQQYLIHLKHHNKYKCTTCDESFASQEKALEHKRDGHVVEGLLAKKCPHCAKVFYKQCLLEAHVKQKHCDPLIHCKHCSKVFKTTKSYVLHFRKLSSDDQRQTFICELCGKQFNKRNAFRQHVSRMHKPEGKAVDHLCKLCNRKFSSRTNLERHLQLHTQEKEDCVCDKCGKTFLSLSKLKDHISYVHSEVQQLKCNECGKQFKRNSDLLRHQSTHSEKRPYACDRCTQTYKRKTHLQRHQMSVHGSAPPARKVQRLIKNANGDLVPLQSEQKPIKKKSGKTKINIEEPVYSLMDVNSGELVTLTISEMQDVTVISKTLPSVLNLIDSQYNAELLEMPYQELWPDKTVPLQDYNIGSADVQQSFEMINTTVDNQTQINNMHLEMNGEQESFTVCHLSENYLNQTAGNLDNIDTRDMIVLPTEELLNTQNVNVDLKVNDENLSLPDYLQHPFQYI